MEAYALKRGAEGGFAADGLRWAQVAEWLMAADCKSAAPWSYGGSNPPLCTTTVVREQWSGRRIERDWLSPEASAVIEVLTCVGEVK